MPRDTPQRRAVRTVFEAEGRPLSPEEVHESGRDHVPSLGIATVYRHIKTLVEDGWLQPVELPGQSARYELSAQPHHHHFVCRDCDQAFDIDVCPSGLEEMAPDGYVVEAHEVVLYGRCPECS